MLLFALIVSCGILSTAGLNYESAEPKTWWAKQISRDFYTAGRISAREVKYASEVGFRSIFAVFNHTTVGSMGEEKLPITDDIERIVTKLTDMEFDIFPSSITTYKSMDAVSYFTKATMSMPKPMLVYCTASYSATATVLLHFLQMTQTTPSYEPKVYTDDFFRISRAIGHDFDMDEQLIALVSEISKEPPIEVRLEPNNKLTNWHDYWHSKFVSSDWFAGGQMRVTHIEAIASAGFESLVNNRLGVTSPPNDTPSQEEVTLLNIRDNTGTYKHGGRQSLPRLLQTRNDPVKPKVYISPKSKTNFEARNPGEFGDRVGYNEEIAQMSFNESGLSYIHLPIREITAQLFYKYVDDLKKAMQYGPVLVHCRSGYRGASVAILAEGYFNCRGSDWAMTQAAMMGYHFTKESTQYHVFREVLDSRRNECPGKHRRSKIWKCIAKAAFFLHLFGL